MTTRIGLACGSTVNPQPELRFRSAEDAERYAQALEEAADRIVEAGWAARAPGAVRVAEDVVAVAREIRRWRAREYGEYGR